MQEKTKKISPIKERILYFVETLGISKRRFYERINVSRGTLESESSITEEILTRFLAAYPDISETWLLTGEGEMLKKSKNMLYWCHQKNEYAKWSMQEKVKTAEGVTLSGAAR